MKLIMYYCLLLLIAIQLGCHGIPISPNETSVIAGNTFEFLCGAPADPANQVSVFINSSTVLAGDDVTLLTTFDNDSTLYQFRPTTREDNGITVRCDDGTQEGILQLTVYFGPVYEPILDKYTVTEGENFTLLLTIVDSNPAVNDSASSLSFNGAPVSGSVVTSTSIFIPTVSRDQAGTYTYRSTNNIVATELIFGLIVNYPPTIVDSLATKCFLVGANATFNCTEVTRADSVPMSSFTPALTSDDFAAQLASEGRVSTQTDTITILNQQERNSTIIVCEASNGVSPNVNATTSVRFGDAPSTVNNLQAITGSRYLQFSWNAPDDDGGCFLNLTYSVAVKQTDTGSTVAMNRTAALQYTASGLYPGTRYTVRVTAVNEVTESNEETGTFMTGVEAPELGGVVVITSLTSTSIRVRWTLVSDGGTDISMFMVTYSSTSVTQNRVSVDGMTLSVDITGFRPEEVVTVTVIARNSADLISPAVTSMHTLPDSGAGGIACNLVLLVGLLVTSHWIMWH